jgi:hypothetical protein
VYNARDEDSSSDSSSSSDEIQSADESSGDASSGLDEISATQKPRRALRNEIAISDSEVESDELETTLAAIQSGEKRRTQRRPRIWSVSQTVKQSGRPPKTLQQRQFERKRKFEEIKSRLHKYVRPSAQESGNLEGLQHRINEGLGTYNALNAYLSKFSVHSNFPTPREAPNLCVAVPAVKPGAAKKNAEICRAILQLDWVQHCIRLLHSCQREYRENQGRQLEDHEVLLKFERGRASVYPKLTGDYMFTMGA